MKSSKTNKPKTNKPKLFCFLCKYAIVSVKNCKEILFRNKKKLVCRHCNKTKHKALEAQYNLFDTSCKKCKKIVKYKNCIACSLCNNFYHGKCLNFSKLEIILTEKLDRNYFCPQCISDILPNYDDTSDSQLYEAKIFKTKIKKQCMICCSDILHRKYQNKHIVYNGNEKLLCFDCSVKGLNNPVRDKNLLEFKDCRICSRIVKYESIFCDECHHWIHPACNGIDKQELQKLDSSGEKWTCMKCDPSNKMKSVNESSSIIHHKLTRQINIIDDFKTHEDCRICKKKVTGKETLACSTCNHWLHKKCIGNFINKADYSSFLNYYADKDWDCPLCKAEILPFIMLNDDEFFMELLDMYYKPIYIDRDNFINVYNQLNSINFFTTEENKQANCYIDDHDPDIKFKSFDSCEYTIDTEEIQIKSTNELTLATFNIRSIKKNFSNFTTLLSRIKSKIHIICLNESWLGPLDNIKDYEIEGYHTPITQNRVQSRHGGGVLTYLHKDISKFKPVKNLTFSDNYNHCLATEVQVDRKNITLLNIYRSPDYLNTTFLEQFERVIDHCKNITC